MTTDDLDPTVAANPPNLTDDVIRAALQRNGWVVSRTAGDLNIARNTLVAAINRSDTLHLPRDYSAQDIRITLQDVGGDIVKAAQALEVSAHGLRLRMRDLGML